MSELTIADTRQQVFLLNLIELAATIFRGPDSSAWSGIIATGLPQLLQQAPQDAPHLSEALEKLQSALPNPHESGDPLTLLETEYVRLFIASRGGVIAPPYESCHMAEAPRIMGDAALSMRSRLGKCGLEIALDSNEPPDHLAIELEYLYHLLATAWTDNNPAQETKARAFARLEMLPWVRRFRQALVKGEPHSAYLASADLAVAALEAVA